MSGTVITIAVMSETVNTEYNCPMVRWEPDSKGRLAQAALVLYGEQGFDKTTVAEIAERAGLTERTFFRHFTDKKEVLFEVLTERAASFGAGGGDIPGGA